MAGPERISFAANDGDVLRTDDHRLRLGRHRTGVGLLARRGRQRDRGKGKQRHCAARANERCVVGGHGVGLPIGPAPAAPAAVDCVRCSCCGCCGCCVCAAARCADAPSAAAVDGQVAQQCYARACDREIARGDRLVRIRLLELEPRLREIRLRGQPFAVAKLVDVVGACACCATPRSRRTRLPPTAAG